MRTEKELFAALAYMASGIQQEHQRHREYNPAKHFLMTIDEFVCHFDLMGTTTNVGWYTFKGVPIWIGNLNSEAQ